VSILVLKGMRIIDPSQNLDTSGTIVINEGNVVAIENDGNSPGVLSGLQNKEEEINIVELPSHWILSPGFVDLHTHLREPGFEGKETIESGTRAAAKGGFTTVCCMPNTNPVIDTRTIVEYVLDPARNASIHIRPIGAITKGQEGKMLTEMYELADAGVVAFSDDGHPVSSSRIMRLAMQHAGPLKLPLVEHCQDNDLVGEGVMNEGMYSTQLGLKGWPAIAENIMLMRDIEMVRDTGTRYHAAHLSTAGAVEIIRQAKREGLPVTAEVTPHHLLLTDGWVAGNRTGLLAEAMRKIGMPLSSGNRYDTSTKVNPPLRTEEDNQALLEGLIDGTIDAIATDHAPHSITDKNQEYDKTPFGITGLETTLSSLLALVHAKLLPLNALIDLLTRRPSQCWGLGVGSLKVGMPADLTVFDPDETWTVEPSQFVSLGKNTPLAHIILRGCVKLTLLDGREVYRK
jgi:dihydroorotase